MQTNPKIVNELEFKVKMLSECSQCNAESGLLKFRNYSFGLANILRGRG